MELRTGIGFDIHRINSSRKLILCGLPIPSEFGLDGHSDADVVLHALSDAILGALALPDIGTFFPNDKQYTQDMDSKNILKFVNNKMIEQGFKISNIDIVIIAESPKLNKFFDQMKLSLSDILNIAPTQIGIKAKTNEGMGEIGNKQAIATIASALLQKS